MERTQQKQADKAPQANINHKGKNPHLVGRRERFAEAQLSCEQRVGRGHLQEWKGESDPGHPLRESTGVTQLHVCASLAARQPSRVRRGRYRRRRVSRSNRARFQLRPSRRLEEFSEALARRAPPLISGRKDASVAAGSNRWLLMEVHRSE